MSAGLIKVFYDTDLRGGHKVLSEVARQHKIHVSKLEPGHYVAFVNKEKSGVKVYAASDVIAYMKAGRKDGITEDVIRQIPRAFLGSPMGGTISAPVQLKKRAAVKKAA